MNLDEPVAVRTRLNPAPRVSYSRQTLPELLGDPNTLAVLGFGAAAPASDDPRYRRVALEPALAEAAPFECWQVNGPVRYGIDGGVRWSMADGWLFATPEMAHDGIDATAQAARAYRCLTDFLARNEAPHVLRLWNYLDAINAGSGDDERYKRFCAGRVDGMGSAFTDGYPAATAIGHRQGEGLLQLYALACSVAGQRVENPRQLSAWRYPRQYGPTAPSFARAMLAPAGDALALSGTASIVGHQSLHPGDLDAQLRETLANLGALIGDAGLGGHLDQRAVLKVYLRDRSQAAAVDACLAAHAPHARRLLLVGDICRRELLVEIDGWVYQGTED